MSEYKLHWHTAIDFIRGDVLWHTPEIWLPEKYSCVWRNEDKELEVDIVVQLINYHYEIESLQVNSDLVPVTGVVLRNLKPQHWIEETAREIVGIPFLWEEVADEFVQAGGGDRKDLEEVAALYTYCMALGLPSGKILARVYKVGEKVAAKMVHEAKRQHLI